MQPPASLKALNDPIYEAFYGLTEQPFAITTDPRFFYLSASHQRAFSELLNGLKRREGLLMLTGETGIGKTTLCRAVLAALGDRTFSAIILNPYMTGAEVLRIVLRDFGLVSHEELRRGGLATADIPQLLDTVEGFLRSLVPLGSHAVIVLDEAQALTPAVLDQIRLLTGLEYEGKRLVQVVLCGQPGLLQTIKIDSLLSLNERITRRVELTALPAEDIRGYIQHRLGVAGGTDAVRFDTAAIQAVADLSRGLPRRVNVLCDRALQEGRIEGVGIITSDLVKRAARALAGVHAPLTVLPPEAARAAAPAVHTPPPAPAVAVTPPAAAPAPVSAPATVQTPASAPAQTPAASADPILPPAASKPVPTAPPTWAPPVAPAPSAVVKTPAELPVAPHVRVDTIQKPDEFPSVPPAIAEAVEPVRAIATDAAGSVSDAVEDLAPLPAFEPATSLILSPRSPARSVAMPERIGETALETPLERVDRVTRPIPAPVAADIKETTSPAVWPETSDPVSATSEFLPESAATDTTHELSFGQEKPRETRIGRLVAAAAVVFILGGVGYAAWGWDARDIATVVPGAPASPNLNRGEAPPTVPAVTREELQALFPVRRFVPMPAPDEVVDTPPEAAFPTAEPASEPGSTISFR